MLENNFIDHFWTEKIADCYLGLAFPFYSGCRNLHHYFDAQAFEYIDLDDVPGAAKTIETAIAGRLSETRLVHLREARRKVLFEYNIFNEVNEVRNAVLRLQTGFEGLSSLSYPEEIHPIKKPKGRKSTPTKITNDHAAEVKALRRRVANLEARLTNLHNSRSWRITAPLRVVSNTLSRLLHS